MFWGLTPSLDLLNEFELNPDFPSEINVLLLGSADARHIFTTISKKYRHRKVKINFYVMEACLETVAKQLLLLNVALQPSEVMGLLQKTRTFMEFFGNSILRPGVAKYLTNVARELIKMITNAEYMKTMMPFVNMDVQYKDRDYLENLFKFWCGSDEFNIFKCWDNRLRKYLGIRYDTRAGAFDWDLHMRYRIIGGSQVCNQEYQHFRQTGVAFGWLESEVSKPNRSMVCGIIPNGTSFAHIGYMGDMVTGPYVAYGLECEDADFLKSQNGKCYHRATDVTERNLMQIFYEIEHQEKYTHIKMNDMNLGMVVTQLAQVKVVDIGASGDYSNQKFKNCINIEDNITFLSFKYFKLMKHRAKFHNMFDLIYVNNAYVKYFDAEIISLIARDNCRLIIENELFVLSNRDQQLEEYEVLMRQKIENLHVKSKEFRVNKDAYARFNIIKSH